MKAFMIRKYLKNERCTSFSVLLLDSVVNVEEKYYLQIFLEEWKYAVKKKKIIILLTLSPPQCEKIK